MSRLPKTFPVSASLPASLPATQPASLPAFLLVSLLASPLAAQGWTNLGNGKPGSYGVPTLVASAPRLGTLLQVSLSAARPNALVVFVVGDHRIDLPVWGGTLVPSPDILVTSRTDANGGVVLNLPVPRNPKLIVMQPVIQALVVDPNATASIAFSNALQGSLCQWYRTTEDFTTNRFFDVERSAGTWGGGQVVFGQLGGSGLHGDFDPTLGVQIGQLFVWDLDTPGGFKIPKSHTTSGQDEFVTDGRFHFQSLVVPAGVEVLFLGSNPARLHVRGVADVAGALTANGESLPQAGRPGSELVLKGTQALKGERGGRGGAMGGSGGDGGDRGDGTRHTSAFDGRPGSDVRLPSGHAYATRYTGTGGSGSPQWPTSGLDSAIVFSFYNVISQMSNRGGGGGGFVTPGGTGAVVWSAPNTGNQKYAAPGTTPGGVGTPFPAVFPNYTNGLTRQDHFVVGGAGGGGGGSCCGAAIKSVLNDRWRVGRAGGGGGGGIGLRIGGSLTVRAGGRVEARGGAGAFDDANFNSRGMMTPGGGGSGGSLFLQVTGATDNKGSISTAGGQGGVTAGNATDPIYFGMRAHGGGGSDGIVHFETAQDPNKYPVGTTVPAKAPVAKLDPKDRDPVVGVRSRWYATHLTWTPEFLRYEVEALVDGKPVTFSDDPRRGVLAGPGAPLIFRIQGARLHVDSSGRLAPQPGTTPTAFVQYVGPFGGSAPTLFGSGQNGFRLELLTDRGTGRTVVVKKVTVFWCL